MPPRSASTSPSLPDTLHAAWSATVAAAPDAVALIEGATSRAFTRADLDARATAFAATLPASVARQRVAFALPNGPDWFAAFLGLLRTGATPIPLDPSEPAANQLALATAARAAFAWIDGQLASTSVPLRSQASALSPSASALIKLTSGSTGTPRALPFTHAQMLADGRHVCATMDIRATDLNLAVIPLGHSYGLGNLVVPLLAQGTALVCADLPVPHALAALAARHRPTVFPAVPALLRALAEADLPANAFATLRTVISAGSPLPPATAAAFRQKYGLPVHSFYGSSETGGIAYDRAGDGALHPLDGVSITPLRGQRVRVNSPAVFRAAGHRPADRVRLESDGSLVLLGRTGRLVKIAGRRLDLAELENALRRIPDIADAFVAPHPDDPEHLAAVLATPLAPLPLRALLRAHLAPWKIPRRLVPVAAFPLTARGKPDSAALRALLAR